MNDARLRESYGRVLSNDLPRDSAPERCVAPEDLLAIARHEIDPARRLALLDHVIGCDDCRRELDLLRAVEASSGRSARRSRWTPRARVWSFVSLGLAAALVLAVGLNDGIRRAIRGGGGESGEPVRGATQSLGLVAPDPAAAVSARAPVSFAWHAVPEATRYQAEVMRPDGQLLWSATTTDTTLAMPVTVGLAPNGEYRWWVRATTTHGAQIPSAIGRFLTRPD